MNKYQFNYDEKTGEYRLSSRKEAFYFSPRVFAQSFFYKMGEQNRNRMQNLVFRAGAYDEVSGNGEMVIKNNTQRYPIVTDIVPSQNTANVLKNLLYGQDGILSGHLTYMYQSWGWAAQDKDFGEYLKKLGENNGMILDALGNIVVAFGGDPNFMTTNARNWTSQYINTTKNREQFLRNAIQMEGRAIRDVEMATERVENVSLKRLLTSIKEDKQNIVRDMQNLLQ